MYSTLLFSVSFFPVFRSRTEFLPSPFLGFWKKKPRKSLAWDPLAS